MCRLEPVVYGKVSRVKLRGSFVGYRCSMVILEAAAGVGTWGVFLGMNIECSLAAVLWLVVVVEGQEVDG